jgi:DNA-binding MarR family transcriptional regulator
MSRKSKDSNTAADRQALSSAQSNTAADRQALSSAECSTAADRQALSSAQSNTAADRQALSSAQSNTAADRQALVASLGAALQAYQRSTDAFDDQVARLLKLNRTDLRCLDWLFDGPKTAGQLADAIGLSTAATTTLLDRLEKRGLIQRVRDPLDRRKVLAQMTELGYRLTGQFYGPMAAEGGVMLARFTDAELTMLLNCLAATKEVTDRHLARIRQEKP